MLHTFHFLLSYPNLIPLLYNSPHRHSYFSSSHFTSHFFLVFSFYRAFLCSALKHVRESPFDIGLVHSDLPDHTRTYIHSLVYLIEPRQYLSALSSLYFGLCFFLNRPLCVLKWRQHVLKSRLNGVSQWKPFPFFPSKVPPFQSSIHSISFLPKYKSVVCFLLQIIYISDADNGVLSTTF